MPTVLTPTTRECGSASPALKDSTVTLLTTVSLSLKFAQLEVSALLGLEFNSESCALLVLSNLKSDVTNVSLAPPVSSAE